MYLAMSCCPSWTAPWHRPGTCHVSGCPFQAGEVRRSRIHLGKVWDSVLPMWTFGVGFPVATSSCRLLYRSRRFSDRRKDVCRQEGHGSCCFLGHNFALVTTWDGTFWGTLYSGNFLKSETIGDNWRSTAPAWQVLPGQNQVVRWNLEGPPTRPDRRIRWTWQTQVFENSQSSNSISTTHGPACPGATRAVAFVPGFTNREASAETALELRA